MSMDAIIITGAELRAWGFDEAPDGDYLAGEWLLDWLAAEDEREPWGETRLATGCGRRS